MVWYVQNIIQCNHLPGGELKLYGSLSNHFGSRKIAHKQIHVNQKKFEDIPGISVTGDVMSHT